jgi:hypothetical protein
VKHVADSLMGTDRRSEPQPMARVLTRASLPALHATALPRPCSNHCVSWHEEHAARTQPARLINVNSVCMPDFANPLCCSRPVANRPPSLHLFCLILAVEFCRNPRLQLCFSRERVSKKRSFPLHFIFTLSHPKNSRIRDQRYP